MSHGSKSGDNAQTNVGTVGIFKDMLKMKISVKISLIQFWGAKAGIWHLGYVPFSSISDGHFHHYIIFTNQVVFLHKSSHCCMPNFLFTHLNYSKLTKLSVIECRR